ncbi:MAG: hypothetical protein V7K88_27290 [Nostoc sp.]|uniref:hypothetical protein n=1 Tax=Nostoc sp. TaxID=1180 RepID=UPI002FF7F6D8
MQLELDHIFVCVEPEASPTDILTAFELTLVHKVGFKEITALQVILLAVQNFSAEVRTLINLGLVQFS